MLKCLCSVSDGGAARSSGGLATLLMPFLGCGFEVVMSTDWLLPERTAIIHYELDRKS